MTHPAHKRAKHSARMPALSGVIHPTRTDPGEVLHAVARSEIAWGRYVRDGSESLKREWEAANDRVTRLVHLLAEQESDE